MFCKVLLCKNKKALKSRLIIGAGGGNRTLTISLEGWSSTIKLHPHLSMFLLYILPFNLSTTFYKKIKKSKFKILG